MTPPALASTEAAVAWIDETVNALDTEDAPLPTARGLVLAKAIRAVQPIPTEDRAAVDGFAVQASASLGASVYNPIRLPLIAVALFRPEPRIARHSALLAKFPEKALRAPAGGSPTPGVRVPKRPAGPWWAKMS